MFTRPARFITSVAVAVAVAVACAVALQPTGSAAPAPGGHAAVRATVASGQRAASQAAVLVVAPGRVGTLRMGSTVSAARKAGWISWGRQCGWTAGKRAYLLDAQGNEVYKAYPDKVTRTKVKSMHAMGVVTSKGVRTTGLGLSPDAGSTLAEARAAYPKLKRLGSWPDYGTGRDWLVYTTGSRKSGWLDLYVHPETRTVGFVQVRANKVKWGELHFEC